MSRKKKLPPSNTMRRLDAAVAANMRNGRICWLGPDRKSLLHDSERYRRLVVSPQEAEAIVRQFNRHQQELCDWGDVSFFDTSYFTTEIPKEM